ncbi:MAG: AEC family transporter [Halothiobacillaceae bacterium]|nr:AEC family transporter [Halothiobacillaceae bacterium]
MLSVVSQMAVMVLGGIAWRLWRFGGWEAERARTALTTLVYYLMLPALVLSVLWRAPLDVDALRIPLAAAAGVFGAMLLMALVGRVQRPGRARLGALLLAASFPNATYLGLPVLESLYGDAGRAIAIQYDLFACTPILLSLGIYIAARMGGKGEAVHPLGALLRVPPLWAAVLAVALNLGGIPQPEWLFGILDRLGAGVVPIMLVALGMSLRLDALRPSSLIAVAPAVLIQLFAMPLIVLGVGSAMGLSGMRLVAVVLEGAMPVMVLGLVLCDRYGLDTALYATAATLSVILSLLTLPLWFAWGGG